MNREDGITFEWDEQKRQTNIVNRGVDFTDAAKVLEDPKVLIEPDIRYDYGEARFNAYGLVSEKRYCVCFTIRGENVIRVISMRKVHLKEWKKYYDNH